MYRYSVDKQQNRRTNMFYSSNIIFHYPIALVKELVYMSKHGAGVKSIFKQQPTWNCSFKYAREN
jgi:hypothetical protein